VVYAVDAFSGPSFFRHQQLLSLTIAGHGSRARREWNDKR
jgi:hypothetical protein